MEKKERGFGLGLKGIDQGILEGIKELDGDG
jgi:hypothetical protein